MTDYGSLIEFRELVVVGCASKMEEFGTALEQRLPEGWTRDIMREENARQMGTDFDWLVFNRASTTELPSASLFFSTSEADLKVTNIVPQTVSELSKQEYNEILREFYISAVMPVCEEWGLHHELTPDFRPLTFWLTETAADKLLRFSTLANKSTGSAHPLDRNRWFDFVYQVVTDQSNLDADTLLRWLVNIQHWSLDSARDLILEYEFGRDLLIYAREKGNG